MLSIRPPSSVLLFSHVPLPFLPHVRRQQCRLCFLFIIITLVMIVNALIKIVTISAIVEFHNHYHGPAWHLQSCLTQIICITHVQCSIRFLTSGGINRIRDATGSGKNQRSVSIITNPTVHSPLSSSRLIS